MMACVIFAGCGGDDGGSSSGGSGDGGSTEKDSGAAADVNVEEETGLKGDYEPNSDYDEYTLVEYTIEDAGATFVATVSRKSDKSKYEVHCDFYGDEQVSVLEGDKVTEDKTGFMETDTPLIVEAAEKQGIWGAIK